MDRAAFRTAQRRPFNAEFAEDIRVAACELYRRDQVVAIRGERAQGDRVVAGLVGKRAESSIEQQSGRDAAGRRGPTQPSPRRGVIYPDGWMD